MRWFVILWCTLGGAGCSLGQQLSLDASQAEFPVGEEIFVDGRLDATEWAQARRFSVSLPDGRRINVLMQRDREHFSFAFDGLGERSSTLIHPEIFLDLWGNATSDMDGNDWWLSVDLDDCWARGGHGEGDCDVELPGWDANNLPLQLGEAIEVTIEFDALRFHEIYENEIGLAIIFVDARGTPVAAWPHRAEAGVPRTWVSISLEH